MFTFFVALVELSRPKFRGIGPIITSIKAKINKSMTKYKKGIKELIFISFLYFRVVE